MMKLAFWRRPGWFSRNRVWAGNFTIAVLAVLWLAASPAAADTCSDLKGLKLENTTVVSAETVAAGALPAQPDTPEAVLKLLPAFCRVRLEIEPAKDSEIKVEVWMPSAGWNGKFLGRGNGGFAGSINYAEMSLSVLGGYATASTDTGHSGGVLDAAWAIGHPEKIVDFGYRAIHEMTLKAKTVIAAYYDKPAQYAYFGSCSNGGRAGLMEAQRFPDDYDGILAGAPANDWTRNFAGFVWDAQALFANPASRIPASKLPLIHAAAMDACDGVDGVKDGVIADPRECRFAPSALLCKGADSSACLSAAQVAALSKIYSGPVDAKGRQVFPGYFPGGELGAAGWAAWLNAADVDHSVQALLGIHFFADMVYGDPGWNYKNFQVDRDLKAADDKLARTLNATDPDLKAFAAHGGKLILYQGWSDAAIPPLNTIDYYNSVVSDLGARSGDTLRLYMVPGLQHCDGGAGAVDFGQHDLKYDPERNIFSSLERWVETGVAPGTIIAAQHKQPGDISTQVLSTRPICPYPLRSRYKGAGDTRSAANFVCAK